MTSAYTPIDISKPSAVSQTITQMGASANANDVALWYACVQGGSAPGFVFSASGGTVEEPLYYLWTNGTQIVRSTNTWSSGNLTQQVWAVSQDTGSSYATVCTQTFSYDVTTGALTATTGAGGMASVFGYLIGKFKALRAAYDAHVASTSAHGIGTMAAQNANAVVITGGSASLTVEREAKVALGTVTSSTALNWSGAGLYTATIANAAAAFTHSSLPNGVVGYLTLDLTISTVPTTLLAGVAWQGGTAPTFVVGHRAIVTLMCHDGSTISGSFWSA